MTPEIQAYALGKLQAQEVFFSAAIAVLMSNRAQAEQIGALAEELLDASPRAQSTLADAAYAHAQNHVALLQRLATIAFDAKQDF